MGEKPAGGFPVDCSLNSPEIEDTEEKLIEPSAIISCKDSR